MIKALEYACFATGAVRLHPATVGQHSWRSGFGDFPDAVTLIGMGVVVAGGLLVAASRRRQGRSPKDTAAQ